MSYIFLDHYYHHGLKKRESFRPKGITTADGYYENERSTTCLRQDMELCIREDHPNPIIFKKRCTPIFNQENDEKKIYEKNQCVVSPKEDPCYILSSGMTYVPRSCQESCCLSSTSSSHNDTIPTIEPNTSISRVKKKSFKCILL